MRRVTSDDPGGRPADGAHAKRGRMKNANRAIGQRKHAHRMQVFANNAGVFSRRSVRLRERLIEDDVDSRLKPLLYPAELWDRGADAARQGMKFGRRFLELQV